MSTYQGLRPGSTYLGLRTKVYLPRSTYLGLPTRSTYSGLLKWIAGYTYWQKKSQRTVFRVCLQIRQRAFISYYFSHVWGIIDPIWGKMSANYWKPNFMPYPLILKFLAHLKSTKLWMEPNAITSRQWRRFQDGVGCKCAVRTHSKYRQKQRNGPLLL